MQAPARTTQCEGSRLKHPSIKQCIFYSDGREMDAGRSRSGQGMVLSGGTGGPAASVTEHTCTRAAEAAAALESARTARMEFIVAGGLYDGTRRVRWCGNWLPGPSLQLQRDDSHSELQTTLPLATDHPGVYMYKDGLAAICMLAANEDRARRNGRRPLDIVSRIRVRKCGMHTSPIPCTIFRL